MRDAARDVPAGFLTLAHFVGHVDRRFHVVGMVVRVILLERVHRYAEEPGYVSDIRAALHGPRNRRVSQCVRRDLRHPGDLPDGFPIVLYACNAMSFDLDNPFRTILLPPLEMSEQPIRNRNGRRILLGLLLGIPLAVKLCGSEIHMATKNVRNEMRDHLA